MNSNRLGPRRLNERVPANRRRGTAPSPAKAQDRTALYVGLGVGGFILVVALAFAMSGGSGASGGGTDLRADRGVKESIETAQKMANKGNLAGAVEALDEAIANPAYRGSNLLSKARILVADYRRQIAFEQEAAAAINDFDRRISESVKDQTALKKAEEFWRESGELFSKYGGTAKGSVLARWREDLTRWRGTTAQEVWEKDYNRTKDRIKTQHLDAGNFNQAVKDWRQFQASFDSNDLRARVDSELRSIDLLSAAAAVKLVESAGTGPMARQKIEAEQERFMGTEGQKIIAQKLKSLP